MKNLLENKRCVNGDRRKIVVVQEHKRKYVGSNQQGKLIHICIVDNCLITSGCRCDFLLVNSEEKRAYFIELKGRDLVHAIEQIDATINQYLMDLNGFSINARVVLTKVNTPDILSTQFIKLERRLKKLNGSFLKSVNHLEEQL